LVLLSLRGPLLAGRIWAWLGLALATVLLLWVATRSGRHDGLFALYAAPVLIYLFMAGLFGRTLRNGQVPLITRMAAGLQGSAEPIDDETRRYTRQLTAVWTALFVLIAAVNAALA